VGLDYRDPGTGRVYTVTIEVTFGDGSLDAAVNELVSRGFDVRRGWYQTFYRPQ